MDVLPTARECISCRLWSNAGAHSCCISILGYAQWPLARRRIEHNVDVDGKLWLFLLKLTPISSHPFGNNDKNNTQVATIALYRAIDHAPRAMGGTVNKQTYTI